MKLIIDIDEYDLEWIRNGYCIPLELNEKMTEMIINGIPLDDIWAEIEEKVLESLSDGGDDWFTADKVNKCLEIIDKHIGGCE